MRWMIPCWDEGCLIRTRGCGNSSFALLRMDGRLFSTVQDRKKAGSRSRQQHGAHESYMVTTQGLILEDDDGDLEIGQFGQASKGTQRRPKKR